MSLSFRREKMGVRCVGCASLFALPANGGEVDDAHRGEKIVGKPLLTFAESRIFAG